MSMAILESSLQKPPIPQQLDPIERYVPLGLKLGTYAILILFFYQAAITFAAYKPGVPWPTLLNIVRTFIFLPLHEGGHFLFMFFGSTLMILGGSFWQIMFPLLSFLMAMKKRSEVAPFALFWAGENMMDVSLYIRDATVRQLPLLGGHKSRHDWYNLLSGWGALDSAETLGDLTYYSGMIICIGSIATGIFLAFLFYRRPKQPVAKADSEN